MKLFLRGFIIFIFLFLFSSFGDKAHALQTPEIFATGMDAGSWDIRSNLYGPPDSIYATATNSYLSGYVRFTQSLDIPLSATITSLVFKIYAAPSGNSGGSNYWNVYLGGDQCSYRPSLSLGNGLRIITIDSTNCTGTNNFTNVVQANKLALNLSTGHVIGYPQSNGTHTMVWDAIGVYATYELPESIPIPMPPDIPLTPGSVWEWITATTSATQKADLSDVVSVSSGSDHTLVLKKDGTVWAWGNNDNGQLGIGTISGYLTNPVQVKSSENEEYLTNVKAIAAGTKYSMALKDDGTVWTWGTNGYGARGTGVGVVDPNGSSKLLTATQVKTSNNFSQITAIAAGRSHSIVLKSDGSVFTWGWNDYGQTGTGYSIYSSIVNSPMRVMDRAISVTAGELYSLVVKNDGTVWGSGRIGAGQLGSITNGSQSYVMLPIQIPGIDGVKSVWAKDNTSMALMEDSTVFEWGSGRYLPYDANPRQIPNLADVDIITGGISSLANARIGAAIKNDGTVWMWDMYYLFARPIPGLSNIGSISIGRYVPNLAVVKISDSAPTPTPTLILSPTPTPKTPLILIPGIGGSEFKSNEYFESTIKDCGSISPFNYQFDEIVWVNAWRAGISPCDEYFDILKLKIDGQTPEYPQIVLNGKFLGSAYGDFIKFFEDNGYKSGETLFLFPYDWRKDISLTLTPLNDLINTIKTQEGTTKVDIVAHSMGGLVARNYIADLSRAQKVRKLFTLGTPHLGSVEFLKNLRFGGCLKFELGPLCFSISRSEIKDILQNLISGYELVPSQEYFNFYNNQDKNHISPYKYNGQSFSYDQLKSFLTDLNYNTSLFGPSESFHALDNQFTDTNGVEVTNIVGSGLGTLGQIREKSVKNFLGNTIVKKDGFSINGDKTVPLFSASLIDSDNNKSLLGDAAVFYTKQNHGELVASGSGLNLVKNILNNNSPLLAGVSTQPYPFSGTQISVHSPVNINVYDSDGRHTGPTSDGNFETNIPGSSYDTLDDAKFIFLPDDGVYNIKFEATDQGSFDFKIRRYEDDEITNEFLYKDVALEDSTIGETELDTTSNIPPILQMDENGDGAVDEEVGSSSNLEGGAIFDEIPPTTDFQISGVLGNNGWFRSDVNVTLNPQDDSTGSGILKTEYSLDNGEAINAYNSPFVVSSEKINKLKFRSVDNAGNEEDPVETEIKIDKTAPEAKIFIGQDKQDLIVTGIDVNPTTVVRLTNALTRKKNDAFYIINDLTGNTLRLDVREVDSNNKDKFRIYSMQYKDDPAIMLENNHFNVIYDGRKQRSNVIEQNFELKGEVRIRIQYDARKNKSIIIVRENNKEKVKEIRNGLTYLNLLTDQGQLKTSY